MTVRYTRQFRLGNKGPDVEGVGRALARYHHKLVLFMAQPRWMRQRWGTRKQKQLQEFKRKHKLKPDYIYGPRAHAALSRYFDAKARSLMEAYHPPPPEAQQHWLRLMAAMKALHNNSRGYVYGGGHGSPLSSLDPSDGYDCSSSTSKVLFDAGMFPGQYALTSGRLANEYGKPGKGQFFTVYAHSGHAWIRLHKSIYWRFDTSPYGDTQSPKSGPRLRFLPRLTWGFTARHWPGM